MSYKSLLVHLELERDNTALLNIAAGLAAQCGARVIGVAACQPIQVLFSEGWSCGDILLQDRTEIGAALKAAETQFRTLLAGRVSDLEWRSIITYGPLADYIAAQAAGADLVITRKDMGASLFDETRRTNIGDLVMRAGRPVLLVPDEAVALNFDNVILGWKDSREARRAAADALPLLRLAGKCRVLEVCAASQLAQAQARVDEVAAWLAVHGVQAVGEAAASSGTDTGFLHATLLARHCHLFVAGAFGRSRLNEWVFGGVTGDVLMNPEFCVLLSH